LSKVSENSAWQSFVMGTYWASAKLVILFAILCYLISGYQLSAERIFVAVSFFFQLDTFWTILISYFDQAALYNSSRLPIALFLPFAFQSIFECRVSLSRLQKFLELEEYDESDTTDKIIADGIANDETHNEKVPLLKVKSESSVSSISDDEKPLVELINYSSTWNAQNAAHEDATVLRNISLSVRRGQLVVIAGAVGSGKSSLLLSILRETQRTWGSLRTRGRVAYTSQEAWIFPGTIRDNILFGNPYVKSRYEKAVEICALKQDFSQCIRKHLRSKATILVTHQVQHLQSADLVILMRGGEIVASGDLEELKQTQIYNEIIQETEKSYNMQRTESEGGANVRSIKFSISEETDNVYSKNDSLNDLTHSRLSLPSPSISAGSYSPIAGKQEEELPYVEEDRAQGAVPWRVYFLYIRAMAHPWILALLMILTNAAELATKQYNEKAERNAVHEEYVDHLQLGPFTFRETLTDYRNVFIAMVCTLVVASIIRAFWFRLTQVTASRVLHDMMFQRVVGTRIIFFDKNPIGRILNRFSKDIGTLDDQLSFSFFDFAMGMLTFFGYFIVIIVINPLILAITAPLILVFIFLRSFYLSTSRDVKRLEATTRSPLYSHISSVMHGLVLVRAFSNQQFVISAFHKYQMVSVERIVDYSELPLEPINEGEKPPDDWPSEGHLHFNNVSFFSFAFLGYLDLCH
uniref:ABC transmembrane type-1 domain-containing protein n=1 Tax=Gongylonema pulchrum TaxID=637853 RepID=A0A183DXE5_9BILA